MRYLVVITALALQAQSFEVATVKVSPPLIGEKIFINLGRVTNGTLTFSNASLSDCLRYAYDLTSDQQLVGPDWIKSKEFRYEIVAKAAPPLTREQASKMLRPLLIERFKLESHWNPREMTYYELSVGKNGSKLQPEKERAVTYPENGLMQINQPHLSMLMLATLLSRFELRVPVVDQTGIQGNHDVKLEWLPATARPDAPDGPSIFTAVKEQLGLQLAAKKGLVQVLVIDHAEKTPIDN